MKKVFLFTLLAVSAALSAQSQFPKYRLVDLGTLPGDDNSEARAINERGQIVGGSCFDDRDAFDCNAVLWTR